MNTVLAEQLRQWKLKHPADFLPPTTDEIRRGRERSLAKGRKAREHRPDPLKKSERFPAGPMIGYFDKGKYVQASPKPLSYWLALRECWAWLMPGTAQITPIRDIPAKERAGQYDPRKRKGA